MMMTVARGAWVKWASKVPHAGIAASVPTATVSPSRTSRAMTDAISSSRVYRATSVVDVAVKVALERRVVDRGGDVLADLVGVDGGDAADERRPGAAGSLDERRDVDPLEEPGSGVVEAPEPAALRVAAEVRRRPELVESDLGELHRGDGPGADHQVDAEASRRGRDRVEVARAAPEDLTDHRDRRDHDRPAADPERDPAPHVTRDVTERDTPVRHRAAIVGPSPGSNQVGSDRVRRRARGRSAR